MAARGSGRGSGAQAEGQSPPLKRSARRDPPGTRDRDALGTAAPPPRHRGHPRPARQRDTGSQSERDRPAGAANGDAVRRARGRGGHCPLASRDLATYRVISQGWGDGTDWEWRGWSEEGRGSGTPWFCLPGTAPESALFTRVWQCRFTDCRVSQKSDELKGTHQDHGVPTPGPAQDASRVTECLKALSKRFLHSVRLVL